MVKKSSFGSIPFLVLLCFLCAVFGGSAGRGGEGDCVWDERVKKEQRSRVVSTEYGEITAVRVGDNVKGSYLLHFFTLEPNSLLLPVMLHADMVFYVHTGNGKLSWTADDGGLKSTDIRPGDVCRLQAGSAFFLQNNLEKETDTGTNPKARAQRLVLRIHAIFSDESDGRHESALRPYTSIRDMVLGYDRKILQAAFQVSEEVIEELLNGTVTPPITNGVSKTKWTSLEMETNSIRRLLGMGSDDVVEVKKKPRTGRAKLFNLLKVDKEFENCYGWSTSVTEKKLSVLKGSNIGLFMVNLTIGSMMGPHWNPMATEVAIVLQGRGMVRVVGPGTPAACRNTSFKVEEGDVFVVPRFHLMAQMAFTSEKLVFMGFDAPAKNNHPQFFAGKASVLQALDKDVLSISLNVTDETLDQLLAPRRDSVILSCVLCAEEELKMMEEERKREREEAKEQKRKQEEERKREKQGKGKKKKKDDQEKSKSKRDIRKKGDKQEEEGRRQEKEKERRKQEKAAAREQEKERRRQEEEEEEEGGEGEKEGGKSVAEYNKYGRPTMGNKKIYWPMFLL